MKDNFKICRPHGAADLIGFGFYKDATPTAFAAGYVIQNVGVRNTAKKSDERFNAIEE